MQMLKMNSGFEPESKVNFNLALLIWTNLILKANSILIKISKKNKYWNGSLERI